MGDQDLRPGRKPLKRRQNRRSQSRSRPTGVPDGRSRLLARAPRRETGVPAGQANAGSGRLAQGECGEMST